MVQAHTCDGNANVVSFIVNLKRLTSNTPDLKNFALSGIVMLSPGWSCFMDFRVGPNHKKPLLVLTAGGVVE